MKYLDSNILAYAFYDNPFRDASQRAIKNGGIINTVNLIEAFNIIEYETNREFAERSIRGLLKTSLKIIDVNIDVIFESLKRSQKYNDLKFIDLVHYITALLNNCERIVSYDKDFNGLEIQRELPN